MDAPIEVRAAEEPEGAAISLHLQRLRELRALGVALLVVLNVLDIMTTAAFMEAGAAEGNPLSASLISRGWIGWVKAGLLLGLGLRVLRGRPRLATTCLLWFVVGVYTTVIVLNMVAVDHLT